LSSQGHTSTEQLTGDHGANASLREQLQKQGVLLPPVNDMRCCHALRDGAPAALHLGDHAPGYHAFLHELSRLPDAEFRKLGADIIFVSQHAWNVGHQYKLLGLQHSQEVQYRGTNHADFHNPLVLFNAYYCAWAASGDLCLLLIEIFHTVFEVQITYLYFECTYLK
jgi:hypothetical protein